MAKIKQIEETTIPGRVIRLICANCEQERKAGYGVTCEICRLHETVNALRFIHETGMTVEAAVRKAEKLYHSAPAGADKDKYKRAFQRQDGVEK